MKAQYDPRADALYITLSKGAVIDSDEVCDGVVLDYGADGRVLGIEVLNLSRRADNPREMAFELMAGLGAAHTTGVTRSAPPAMERNCASTSSLVR
jgi:uncharacterized protein YuzE